MENFTAEVFVFFGHHDSLSPSTLSESESENEWLAAVFFIQNRCTNTNRLLEKQITIFFFVQ